jgi:hypothetical protein
LGPGQFLRLAMGLSEALSEILCAQSREVIGQLFELFGRVVRRLGRPVPLLPGQLLETALHRLIGVVSLLGGRRPGGFQLGQLPLQLGQFLPQFRLGRGQFLG